VWALNNSKRDNSAWFLIYDKIKGRICHSIFDRNYTPATSVRVMIDCIYGLLLNPDVSDPLDSTLALDFYAATGS